MESNDFEGCLLPNLPHPESCAQYEGQMDVDVEECTGPNIDEAEGLGKDKEIFP
jgi:hypothetical protein